MADEVVDDARCTAPNPEELLQRQEARVTMDRVLNAMSLEKRTAFVLHEFEGLSTPEIASTLDIPLGTAASRLRRAREIFVVETERLRAALGDAR